MNILSKKQTPDPKREPDPPAQTPNTSGPAADEQRAGTTETSPQQKALVAADPNAMPDYLIEAAKTDKGQGVSTDRADNIVPLIYVLHTTSPQAMEGDPAYIPGAKGGSIWMRNFGVVSGDQGVLVQPVHFSKDWPEWVPREKGGGMVGRFPTIAATQRDCDRLNVKITDERSKLIVGEDIPDVGDATFVIDPKNRQKVWSRPNGNNLVFTRNHALIVHVDAHTRLAYVLPFKSTGHGVSKEWMGKMMVKRTPGGDLLPSFAGLYRLTTRQRKNVHGTWFQIVVADAGYVSAADYRAGKEFFQAFESGEKVAEAEVHTGDDDGGAAGGGHEEKVPY